MDVSFLAVKEQEERRKKTIGDKGEGGKVKERKERKANGCLW